MITACRLPLIFRLTVAVMGSCCETFKYPTSRWDILLITWVTRLFKVSSQSLICLWLYVACNEVVFIKATASWTLTRRPLSVSMTLVNTLWPNKPVTSADKAPLMSVLVESYNEQSLRSIFHAPRSALEQLVCSSREAHVSVNTWVH